MRKIDPVEAETMKAIYASQCPHLHLWPVPSCHAKSGRIHIQADQTVESFCTTVAHADCMLFLQAEKLGVADEAR